MTDSQRTLALFLGTYAATGVTLFAAMFLGHKGRVKAHIGAILVFLSALGFYVTPQLLGSPFQPTVAMLIGIIFNRQDAFDEATAMSLILILTVAVLYFLADRLFRVSEQWGRQ